MDTFRRRGGNSGAQSTTFGDEGKPKKPSLLPPRNGDTLLDRLTKFYVIPEGSFMRRWDQWMVILATANALLISFMAAFQFNSVAAWVVSYIMDVFFFVDMYIKFHVAYLVGGFWVVFPKEMALHYFKSFEFWFDVFINFPIDIVAFGYIYRGTKAAQIKLSLIRVWKILRTGRVVLYFRRQEKKLHASFGIQVVKFICYAIILTHLIACVWFATACSGYIEWDTVTSYLGSCKADSWVAMRHPEDGKTFGELTLGNIYIASLYWAFITMTTTGYGDIRPANTSERVFATFTALCGILFYGYINGTIASTLSNMDSRRVAYQQRLDAVKQYMTDRDMDTDMQERVLTYYDYVWERNRGIDVRGLFGDMPITFKQEVALSLNNQIIDNAIIFKECSIGFRRMIAIDMKLYLFTANEYVVHRGDLGLEMYFITQGRIDIYATEDLRRPTASLIEGAYFGEFCVVLGHRHEYSARAVCNTDIYVFSKEDLQHTFEAYPADKTLVEAATEKRYAAHIAARKSRGGGTGTGTAKRNTVLLAEIDDLEEEFGVKGSVLKGDIPVRLAGGNMAPLRELNSIDAIAEQGSSGAQAVKLKTAQMEDLELAVPAGLEEDVKKSKGDRRRMSLPGNGYAILDKTMAAALSQSSLNASRKSTALGKITGSQNQLNRVQSLKGVSTTDSPSSPHGSQPIISSLQPQRPHVVIEQPSAEFDLSGLGVPNRDDQTLEKTDEADNV